MLEIHLKDHKFCIFCYSGVLKEVYIFCGNKNSSKVIEIHPLIKGKRIHNFKWPLFPHEGFAQGLEGAPRYWC